MSRTSFLVTILIGYALFFLLSFPLWYPFTLFCVGLIIGYTFHILDRAVQLLVVPDFVEKRKQFSSLVKSGHLMSGISYLINQVPSASASFYFLCLYFPLAFYLITSSGSIVGTGLMMGLGLSYCAHFILSYKKIDEVRVIYFKPVSLKVRNSEIQKLMSAFITIFVLLSAYVVFG